MPGNAAGRTIRLIVCHLVAPKPYEASLKCCGTARIASWLTETIIGSTSKDIVKPPAKTTFPNSIARTKIVNPKIPYTMDGTPAKFIIFVRSEERRVGKEVRYLQ